MIKICTLFLLISPVIHPMLCGISRATRALVAVDFVSQELRPSHVLRSSHDIKLSGLMPRRALTGNSFSDKVSLEKKLESLETLIESVDPELKKMLHPDKQNVLLRGAAAAALLGGYYAQSGLDMAFTEGAFGCESHTALVGYLLHRGAVPKYGHIRVAAQGGDCELVRMLLDASFAAGFTPEYPLQDMSFKMIKLLLSYPINVSTIKQSVWTYESPTEYVVYETLLSKENLDEHKFDDSQKQDLLKKVIVLTQAGDPLTFKVNNPLSCRKSMARLSYWSSLVACCDAHGDWTFGRFPDIATYTRAIIEARHGDDHAKQKAIKTMAAIQAKWEISEEDVTVEFITPLAPSRIQD